ncbi:unnamed protein product [Phytophthora fragariaefolia]|uniref:Unnamed protein product n=1 Tax=Phytophthora fragariaefolia TaxID=1490495 RepID=A0A9W6X9I7_9STRA|nr:unnamed protein product [Phytophthora fragariaefolia]
MQARCVFRSDGIKTTLDLGLCGRQLHDHQVLGTNSPHLISVLKEDNRANPSGCQCHQFEIRPTTTFTNFSDNQHGPAMQPYASRCRTLLTLLLAATSFHHATGASSCKTLLDSSSTLIKSLAEWTGADLSPIDFNSVFKDVDTALPWLSKCAAAVDPKSVYLTLVSSSTVKSCLSALEDFDGDLGTAEGWANLCPIAFKSAVPCVKSIMAESIMDAFSSADGCCDDLLSEVKTLLGGDSLDDMVAKMAELALSIICSQRTFTNLEGESTKEMCGYSIFHSFTFIESEGAIVPLLMDLAQIPNDQMCNAFAGEAFINTKGGSTTISFGTNGVDTMGICLEPIDTLMQYIASWKIFSKTVDAAGTNVSLSDLFASGKSIRGSRLLDYAESSTGLPMMAIRVIDGIIMAMGSEDTGNSTFNGTDDDSSVEAGFLEALDYSRSYAKAILMHIPNNGGCSYSDQSIVPPSEAIAWSASSSGSSSTTTTTTKTTNDAFAIKAVTITFGAALLYTALALF